MDGRSRFDFSAEDSQLIRSKASRLCRQPGFTRADRGDIEHELKLHLFLNLHKFDPARGPWEKWASFILDNCCASLFRFRHADCRSPYREEFSLNATIDDADGREVERHQTIADPIDAHGTHERELDLAELLAGLPDQLRVVALGLAWGTPNAVGEEFDLSRRTTARAIEELRELIRDAGIYDDL